MFPGVRVDSSLLPQPRLRRIQRHPRWKDSRGDDRHLEGVPEAQLDRAAR